MGTGHYYSIAADHIDVSIQLISPASGDHITRFLQCKLYVSIQLISPASGDNNPVFRTMTDIKVSIQLISPASGDFFDIKKP